MRLPSLALSTVLAISAGTALLAPSTGCMMMQGLAPETRLQDHVYLLNDEARWGRVDLASGRCARAYRTPFVRSHRRWSRGISIGDVEITNIAMLQGGAHSLVTYSWIDDDTMELHTTTVRQSWVGDGDGFALAGEDVVSGDDGLYIDVEGGPTRLPEEDVDAMLEGDEEIASAEELDREVSGSAPDETDHEDREPTPGERALAASHPRRRDSQGRVID